jgi:predicted transposase YbfD/YdcC
MNTADIESFLDCFAELRDPRSSRNRLYTVSEILLVCLCAAICSAEGWQDVEDFGKIKIDFLKQYLPYKNGIPSDDTFRRFFRALDPNSFQELFRKWVGMLQKERLVVIAIDGKSLRHSFDGESKMLHMISAYATDARLVLAQEKVEEKSNEITAIPTLLKWLDLRGSTVTIDAMGCQHTIASQILANQGQYIFALKGNQGSLHEDIKTYFTDTISQKHAEAYKDYDKGHGRIESRSCFVEKDVAWLIKRHPQWNSIGSIVRIDATREIKCKTTSETRYYIASQAETPQKILQKIRSHWAIENSLHWILDMSFGEDQSRIRKQNAPQIMAVIRHMALNLLQLKKREMPRQSIKRLRKMAGWDNRILDSILAQAFS